MIILVSTCSDFIIFWCFLQLEETDAYHRKLNEDHLLHAPEFVIKPRSHTVWEKEKVTLHCSVSGWPEPRLTWYVIFLKTTHRMDYTVNFTSSILHSTFWIYKSQWKHLQVYIAFLNSEKRILGWIFYKWEERTILHTWYIMILYNPIIQMDLYKVSNCSQHIYVQRKYMSLTLAMDLKIEIKIYFH